MPSILNANAGTTAFGTTHSIPLGFTATAGRLIEVVFATGSTRTFSGITSGWTTVHDNNATAAHFSAIRLRKVAAGGETSVSVTVSSGIAGTYAAWEVDGLDASPVDQDAEDESGNSTVIGPASTGTTATLSVSDGFAVSVWVADGLIWISGTPSFTNGSTLALEYTGSAPPIVVAGKTLSSTTGFGETVTYSGSNDQVWGCVSVYKPASGVGTATPTPAAAAATVSAAGESVAESTVTAAAGAATVSAVGGTLTVITSSAFKNNTGTVLASLTDVTAWVHNPTTGALVVKLTGQTTNASGVLTLNDAAIVSATTYRVVYRNEDDGAEGMETVTAS